MARHAHRRRRSDSPRPPTKHSHASAATGPTGALLTPAEALATLAPGDAAIGRIDVLPTLDGVDDGLWVLGALAARGVTVLNGAPALLAAHDKLLTARLLRRAGLPHPRTRLITGDAASSPLRPPVVVKPRFGSWGLGVERCDDEESLAALLARVAAGAVVPGARRARAGARAARSGSTCGSWSPHDHVIGAISRVAAPGEWRTNVALGAERRRRDASAGCLCSRARRGAGDRRGSRRRRPPPDGCGRWTVAEINGAVEFTQEYALRPGADPFAEAAFRLGRRRDLRQARVSLRTAAPALRV